MLHQICSQILQALVPVWTKIINQSLHKELERSNNPANTKKFINWVQTLAPTDQQAILHFSQNSLKR